MQFKATLLLLIGLLVSSNNLTASNIIKSANDARLYQTFTLDNQLQVLLISDPLTDKAAVSLDIDVGSASNPKDRPGLAHFLEHMLFLGTEKYPLANEYSAFIDSHGGSQNAFTGQDNTNYFFDIKEDSLEEALDRFSQFFIAPLFSEKYTNRERQAVHAEYQLRLKSDSQRNYSAFKQIINPAHPGKAFFVGSSATLADHPGAKVRDDLVAFYQRFYSANRMTLVVLGKSSLATLKDMVVGKFSAIENRNVAKPEITVNRFLPQQLPVELQVKTIKDFRLLSLTFPTPSTKALFKIKPLSYLGALIGYEGDGSLIAYLKERGYANGLSTMPSHESAVESSFRTSINLTEKGYQNKDLVIAIFFDFIKKLQKNGIQENLYAEEQRLAEQAFNFLARQDPARYVVWLAQNMRDTPQQHWLNANYIFAQYNATVLREYLAYITPANMFINLQSPSITGNLHEPYFGALYQVVTITDQQLRLWNDPSPIPELFIRHPNPYIADDLSLVEPLSATGKNLARQSKPKKYQLATGVSLWHLQDAEFLTPKANLFITIKAPEGRFSLPQKLALNIYSRLLNDKFNKLFYDAAAAGIYLNLYPHFRGLSLKISGYNQRQSLIIEQLAQLTRSKFSIDRFNIIKENYAQALHNSQKNKPYQQLLNKLSEVLTSSSDSQTKIQALDKLTLEDVYQFADSLFNRAEIRILSHGNIKIEQAKQLATLLVKQLNLKSTMVVSPQNQVLILAENTALALIKDIDHPDSAVVLYLQGKDKSYQQTAASNLLTEIIASEYANQLRTEQQLGYLVFASNMSMQQLPGLILVVQSPSASPEKIIQSNQAFLNWVTDHLSSTELDLDKFKQSLITRYQEQERTIYQRSNRFWQELNLDIENFNHREQLVSAVKNLTLSDLQNTWQALLTRQIQLISHSSELSKTK
ncbi:MAG: hypothetical protein OFPII_35120 [Osedax symbiont Rs1]|nr:MAG: hypothetical protein OFPII_35120 [Osedax symbiont Rs1]